MESAMLNGNGRKLNPRGARSKRERFERKTAAERDLLQVRTALVTTHAGTDGSHVPDLRARAGRERAGACTHDCEHLFQIRPKLFIGQVRRGPALAGGSSVRTAVAV